MIMFSPEIDGFLIRFSIYSGLFFGLYDIAFGKRKIYEEERIKIEL